MGRALPFYNSFYYTSICQIFVYFWLYNSFAFTKLFFTYFLQPYRSSHQRCSIKNLFSGNFAKLTGKHLRLRLFFTCNFTIKETPAQVFACDFCKIFKNFFFTEHIRATTTGHRTSKIDFNFIMQSLHSVMNKVVKQNLVFGINLLNQR